MSATSGKVALVNGTALLSGSPCTGSAPNLVFPSSVIDFVGFGSSATCFEGAAPTATPTNTTAAIRKSGGQQDSKNNGADLATGAPTPRNTSSPLLPPVDALA